VLDFMTQFTVDDCTDCTFVIGSVESSFFMRNCKRCTVTVACQQLRLRECFDSTFFVYCGTQPVIESSTGLTFSPWNGMSRIACRSNTCSMSPA
jgi:protein XRP2